MAKSGFTLMEILVSVAIIGAVSVVLVQAFFSTININTKTELIRNTKQNGDYALEIISRMLRSAQSIESECTEIGTATPSVVLRNPNQDTTMLTCVYSDDVTRIASVSSSESTEYLTSSTVTLGGTTCEEENSLQFTCTRATGQPATVKVSFTLYQKGSGIDLSERAYSTFETSVTLRN